MSTLEWAERECRIACKRENPNFNFDDEKSWDYGGSCYRSALKAYKSLCEDGHSGYSFNVTKNILVNLIEGHPLTPITDKDFFPEDRGHVNYSLMSDSYCKKFGLKSSIQCPRKSALFREETLDGKVTYHDNDRYYYVNIEDSSDTYHSNADFLDKMFPITMPYVPKSGKYRIYTQTFLTDKKHGDFDTKGIFYVITPDNEKVELNIFRTEGDDGKWKDITKEEYEALLARRIDKLHCKIADRLIWTLVSNCEDDEMAAKKEGAWKNLNQEIKDKKYAELEELCLFFENADHYQYNTFCVRQDLCHGNLETYKDIPGLMKIGEWLKNLKSELVTSCQDYLKKE